MLINPSEFTSPILPGGSGVVVGTVAGVGTGVIELPPAFLYVLPTSVRFPFASKRAAVPRTFGPGSVPQYQA